MSDQSEHHWEIEQDRKMQLQAGPPEAAFHQLPFGSPALADMDNGMLMECRYSSQMFASLFLNLKFLSATRFYTMNNIGGFLKRKCTTAMTRLSPPDDLKCIRASRVAVQQKMEAEDGSRKYVAHRVAERHRRWEQDRKKYAIERLLPESSLDKTITKRGKTKAAILEGAILGPDGLPLERKVEAVKDILTKREQAALMYECAEARYGCQCSGASNLILTSSIH